ncbi:gene transfer agent family protein [Zavarzinia compransoris]|uniref:Gene transfer agent family protein n=1 Tax=Zavarzinia compransoris TaxID=1264899 RepID=A0A317DZ30_9PROT|nr:gene transfer agent family protein [Zavarzinia compransoris]PWR19150.1 hypothetical protein DKG75_19550 [Zavarzinia compransoris]TDP49164.1 tail tube GTA-gp10-like protein [Zavarzinia compransoris]
MEPAANPARGEVVLRLGGRAFVLRPTFAALAETEEMAGCPLLALARRFLDGTYGVRDVVAVLLPALRRAGGPAGIDDLPIGGGLLSLAPVCARLLTAALRPAGDLPNPLP